MHFSLYCTVYSLRSADWIMQYKVYTVHFTVHSVQFTINSLQCTVYRVKCKVYSENCSVYRLQSKLYIVQGIVYLFSEEEWLNQFSSGTPVQPGTIESSTIFTSTLRCGLLRLLTALWPVWHNCYNLFKPLITLLVKELRR